MYAFILLVFLGIVLLFFLLSFIYVPLGNLVKHIFGDAIDIINNVDEKTEESEDIKNER